MTLVPGWTNRYVGMPFLDCGRDELGLDCWGLVRLIYWEEFGIRLPSLSGDYLDTFDSAAIANVYALERVEWIETDSPVPGDVVGFRVLGIPCHVGVVVDARSFLHCMARRETCLERLTSPAWSARVESFYRHRSRS